MLRKDNPVTAMNGDPVRFNVEVHDEAGNITANPKQIVRCQVKTLFGPCWTDAGIFVASVHLQTFPFMRNLTEQTC